MQGLGKAVRGARHRGIDLAAVAEFLDYSIETIQIFFESQLERNAVEASERKYFYLVATGMRLQVCLALVGTFL